MEAPTTTPSKKNAPRIMLACAGALIIIGGITITALLAKIVQELDNWIDNSSDYNWQSHSYSFAWLYGLWYIKVGIFTALLACLSGNRCLCITNIVFDTIALLGMGITTIRTLVVWNIWNGLEYCKSSVGDVETYCTEIIKCCQALTVMLFITWISVLLGLIGSAWALSLIRRQPGVVIMNYPAMPMGGQVVVSSNNTQNFTSGPAAPYYHPYSTTPAGPPPYAQNVGEQTARDTAHLTKNAY